MELLNQTQTIRFDIEGEAEKYIEELKTQEQVTSYAIKHKIKKDDEFFELVVKTVYKY